jgi:hypothetical protein
MPLPPEAHRLQPDHLPTPFSAEQIRVGCPVGRTIRMREETQGAEPSYRRIRFIEADAEGALQEFQLTDADGLPIGDPTRRRSTWLDLQRHASQPVHGTSVDEEELGLPFGTFACWRYTVQTPRSEIRFWFAKELPGMPVQIEEHVDDAVTDRSLMIVNEVADPG